MRLLLTLALALLVLTSALRYSVESRQRVARSRRLVAAGSVLGCVVTGRWTDGDAPKPRPYTNMKGHMLIGTQLSKDTQVSLGYKDGKYPKFDQGGNRVPFKPPPKSRFS